MKKSHGIIDLLFIIIIILFILTTEMSYYDKDNKEMVIQRNHAIKHNDLFTPYIDVMY